MGACRKDVGVESDTANRLSVVYRKITDIEPGRSNTRQHSPAQIRQIARSIEVFGFNVPFLLDGQLRVIAGHGRLAACGLLGIREVPTICLNHLDENKRKAFQIAENRLAENATWNRSALRRELTLLSNLKLDFALEASGFDLKEIRMIVGEPSSASKTDDAKEEATIEYGSPTSKLGDLWLLGPQRLLCADPLLEASYACLVTKPIELVILSIVVDHNQQPSNTHPLPAGIEMACRPSAEFVSKLFSQLIRGIAETVPIYIRTDCNHVSMVIKVAEQEGLELVGMYVETDRQQPVSSNLRRLEHLMLAFRRIPNADVDASVQFGELNNSVERSTGSGRRRTTSRHDRIPESFAGIADLLRTSSAATVLDPLCGDAVTLIAAEHTGRTCFALERDPARVDQVIRRWETFTGRSAVHAQTGFSFTDLSEIRNVDGQ